MSEKNNRKKYLFDDFTFSEYGDLIELAKKNYSFRKYNNLDKKENFILWRHDVDLSLNYSLELAKIEKEKGVSSTFFLLPHGRFYNLLEEGSREIIKKIHELGHDIGIHFDTHYYNITEESELIKALEFEKKVFEFSLGVKPIAFSFHNTTPFTMSCKDWNYAGLINTYASYFQENVGYCSDSNGYWRYKRLKDVLKEASNERLQILTHPGWWQENAKSPSERIQSIISDRADEVWSGYRALLEKFNNENIDWE